MSEFFQHMHRASDSDFSRTRVWTFPKLFVSIVRGLKKSLTVELDQLCRLFADTEATTTTKQAFSEARKKLKLSGFIAMNTIMVDAFYADGNYKTYNNHRLLAIDGSDQRLPDSADIRKIFGCHGANNLPMASASILYDVENKIIVHSDITAYASSERNQAELHIDALEALEKPTIILFDRGYPSMKLICQITSKQLFFVIRFEAAHFIKELYPAANNNQLDTTINIDLNSLSADVVSKIKIYFPIFQYITLRVIRLKRKGEKDVFLLTNLTQAAGFAYSNFEALYHKRWGIETHYDYLKNKLEIENYATKCSEGILQEFYATLLCANLYQLIASDAEAELIADNKLKEYNQVNRATAAGLSKNELIALVFSQLPIEPLYTNLLAKIKRNTVISKPNRSFPRKVKHKRKHHVTIRPVS